MRPSSLIATLLSVCLAFVIWVVFAPMQLGGQVTYVIVDGNSMEPRFHLGDLLLIREASNYQVGDAVTYRDANMGRYVFHRIIDLNLDRFILKGDNNSWIDTYQPTGQEIVGKLWIHIPKLGKSIEWLRLPVNLAIVVGLFGGSLMYGMIQPGKKKKSPERLAPGLGRNLEPVLYGIGFLGLIFLGLTLYAFTRPVSVNAGSLLYQQEGTFFYSAAGAPGIYDTDKVRSGEPIFPRLTCYLNIGYSYSLTSPQVQEVAGSHQLYARVLDERSGWQRTLPMTSENVFNGSSFMTMSTLDLCQVQALVNMVKQETGLKESTYTLEIVARASASARIAGQVIHETFEPAMRLRFDDVHFYLAAANSEEDPLHFLKQGSVEGTVPAVNTLSLLGLRPTVKSVRTIGLSGLAISLFALLGIGWSAFQGRGDNREALIRLKYGGLLLDVQQYAIEASSPFVDVHTIDDLARLAERQNTMILHTTYHFTSYYLVQAQGITYRFTTSNEKKGVVEVESAHRQALERPGAARNDGLTGSGILNELSQSKIHPTSSMDLPQKIILRYSLNTQGNADLSFEPDGS